MSGAGAEKRYHATAKRCAKLRRAGLTLTQVSENTGVPRAVVASRIELGERLLSLESSQGDRS